MTSQREAALAALLEAIRAGQADFDLVERDEGSPSDIPDEAALLLLRDPVVESQPILSPLCYEITLSAELEIAAYARETLDLSMLAVAGAIAADPSLGGAVDLCELGDPVLDTRAQPVGGPGDAPPPPYFAAQLLVRLFYVAPSPLG